MGLRPQGPPLTIHSSGTSTDHVLLLSLVHCRQCPWNSGASVKGSAKAHGDPKSVETIIAEAFRTTAGPALEVELFLLPMKQQMEKALGYSLL